jgi:hypothetical protein
MNKRATLDNPAPGILDVFSRVDELILAQTRVLNRLAGIIENLNGLSGKLPALGQQETNFNKITISLSTAQIDKEITTNRPFNYLQFWCDGKMDGISVKLGSQGSESIPLNQMVIIPVNNNPDKIYLTNDVLAGRTQLVVFFVRSSSPLSLTTIGVDLLAQSIGNLTVDLVAQTIGNLSINVAAQGVGVYLQAEWAAKEDIDKIILASSTNVNPRSGTGVSYTVPAGKTLYITHLTYSVVSYSIADSDLLHTAYIQLSTGSTINAITSGPGGVFNLPVPAKISSGNYVNITIDNYSNHQCNLTGLAVGYEI